MEFKAFCQTITEWLALRAALLVTKEENKAGYQEHIAELKRQIDEHIKGRERDN